MDTDSRASMGARLREERLRLGLSQLDLSSAGGVKSRTLQDWERGIAAVGSEFLCTVQPHGIDPLYVLTGERSMRQLQEIGVLLTDDEKALLNSFRTASPALRRSLALIAATAARGESQPDAPSST